MPARVSGGESASGPPARNARSGEESRAVGSVSEGMISFPETVFMMGSRLDLVEERVRDLDGKKCLGIGNVLEATPPVWLHLDPFRMMSRMVTNGEYAEFLSYQDEDGDFYDSPELWRHVWGELGFHVQSVQMPYRAPDGVVRYYEEGYSACSSFIEAYLQSMHHEIQRVFLSIPPETEAADGRRVAHEADDYDVDEDEDRPGRLGARPSRDHVLRRLFAFVRLKLRDSMAETADGAEVLTDEDRTLLAEYDDVKAALDDIEFTVKELRRGYGRQVDARLQQAFKKGQVVIEPMLLLERLASAVRSDPEMESAVPLHQVLYPRRWKSSTGRSRKRKFLGTAVAWQDCPVYGVTLFESLAYAAWLSSVTGVPLTLPNEAQYERASSWPAHATSPEKPLKLDPREKLLFPWQDHCPHDFNYFFSREGYEVQGYYEKDRKLYEKLLESTARRLAKDGGGDVLYQMEGFGWHWTCDRYSETERKYSRFQDRDYPRYKERPCVGPGGARVDVVQYVPNRSPTDSMFVLKGSPDVMGGPGLTTRRYATYPLRGYDNVGFRLTAT